MQPLTDAINAAMAKFGIDQQERRVRYFVAQSSFETQGFTEWSEDLTYSTPERLVAVWPSHFTMDPTHTQYAYAPNYTNNPQKLANLVYAGKYGNGDEASGDGWNYRGQGGFDLTFKDNYAAYDKAIYGDGHIVADPSLVSQPADALMSAGWFWNNHGFNALADADSFTQVTTVINGSAVTVPERLQVLDSANAAFTW